MYILGSEQLLSPTVCFGPTSLALNKPVIIDFPHWCDLQTENIKLVIYYNPDYLQGTWTVS